ncbi:MAG: hypothetical protein JSV12_06115 [Candidatus Bathyarchaeota archaeon]|nr:MAG: hypothetical protein JSV12_06115 [Candidatus Bathyarchaeota archaeon]
MSNKKSLPKLTEPKGWRLDNAELTTKVAELETRIMELEKRGKGLR